MRDAVSRPTRLSRGEKPRGRFVGRSPAAMLVAGALGLGALAAGADAPAATIGGADCTGRYAAHATVGGRTACLAPGRLCRQRYATVYRLSGFVCERGKDGRSTLHLR